MRGIRQGVLAEGVNELSEAPPHWTVERLKSLGVDVTIQERAACSWAHYWEHAGSASTYSGLPWRRSAGNEINAIGRHLPRNDHEAILSKKTLGYRVRHRSKIALIVMSQQLFHDETLYRYPSLSALLLLMFDIRPQRRNTVIRRIAATDTAHNSPYLRTATTLFPHNG
jgi:hypothetical protein